MKSPILLLARSTLLLIICLVTANPGLANQGTHWGSLKSIINTGDSELIDNLLKFGRQGLKTSEGSKLIGFDGGSVNVEHPLNKWKMTLVIPAGALDNPTQIGMAVKGNGAEDGFLEFSPSGLTFNQPATLKVETTLAEVGHLLELASSVLHVQGNGSVEELQYTTEIVGGKLFVDVQVPGFSRYGLRGGW